MLVRPGTEGLRVDDNRPNNSPTRPTGQARHLQVSELPLAARVGHAMFEPAFHFRHRPFRPNNRNQAASLFEGDTDLQGRYTAT